MQAQSQKKHMDILHILFFFPFGMDFVAKIMHEALLFFHFIEQFFLQRPRFVAPCWWGIIVLCFRTILWTSTARLNLEGRYVYNLYHAFLFAGSGSLMDVDGRKRKDDRRQSSRPRPWWMSNRICKPELWWLMQREEKGVRNWLQTTCKRCGPSTFSILNQIAGHVSKDWAVQGSCCQNCSSRKTGLFCVWKIKNLTTAAFSSSYVNIFNGHLVDGRSSAPVDRYGQVIAFFHGFVHRRRCRNFSIQQDDWFSAESWEESRTQRNICRPKLYESMYVSVAVRVPLGTKFENQKCLHAIPAAKRNNFPIRSLSTHVFVGCPVWSLPCILHCQGCNIKKPTNNFPPYNVKCSGSRHKKVELRKCSKGNDQIKEFQSQLEGHRYLQAWPSDWCNTVAQCALAWPCWLSPPVLIRLKKLAGKK